MGRKWQVFIAPGDEEQDLPIPESPWHVYREAIIPIEHWEVITDFAEKNIPGFGKLLHSASYLDEDCSQWSNEKTTIMYEGLKKLCILIAESEPLTPEITDKILEDHPPEDHTDMIKAVMAVIEESQRMGEMFDSYVNS